MAYYHNPHHHFCGCYYVSGPTPTYGLPPIVWLPQLALSAHTTIMSTTSRTLLKQTFSNPSSTSPITEASYTFPLYDGVGVVGFKCRIGKKVITGLVKEKDKAKAVYDAAVSRGETAGLLTQLPESSDVFTTRIGNIPAGETVIVEITYFGELKHDAEVDGIRFTIPTKIAPRYGSLAGGSMPSNVTQKRGKTGIEITVDVCMPEGTNLRGLQSPSHPIAVNIGSLASKSGKSGAFEPNKGGATLSLGSAELEKDFVILVQVPEVAKPQALLETHPTIEGQRALMCTLVPKFQLQPAKPEIVFLVDRSGSMGGSMQVVIAALQVFLKSLPVGVKFNICSFGSKHSLLWKKSKSYDQTTLKEAVKYVEKMDANFGGTEMYQPIKAVIENRYKDLQLEVMLLTDGEIWNQEELFTYLNKAVGESEGAIRVFTLGIGDSVSHSLIEGIARAGNGFSQAVGLDEKLDAKVVRMLKGGLSPHIRDYRLEVKYAGLPNSDDDECYEIVEKVSEGLRILSLEPPQPTALQKKISLFDEDVDMDRSSSPKPEDLTGETDKYTHLPPVTIPKVLQAPSAIPPLFPFSRTVVYLLLSPRGCQRTPTSVILRGTAPQGPLELEIPVQILAEKGETIHQLAARKAVGELEEGRGWIASATDEGGVPIKERFEGRFSDMVEREAVRLGVEFQVGGKWCSFVAVESNDAEIAAKKSKDLEKIKDIERRDSSKVLLFDQEKGETNALSEEGYEDVGGSEGVLFDPEKDETDSLPEERFVYTPGTSEGTRSIASSVISTGTLVSTNTLPPVFSAPPAAGNRSGSLSGGAGRGGNVYGYRGGRGAGSRSGGTPGIIPPTLAPPNSAPYPAQQMQQMQQMQQQALQMPQMIQISAAERTAPLEGAIDKGVRARKASYLHSSPVSAAPPPPKDGSTLRRSPVRNALASPPAPGGPAMKRKSAGGGFLGGMFGKSSEQKKAKETSKKYMAMELAAAGPVAMEYAAAGPVEMEGVCVPMGDKLHNLIALQSFEGSWELTAMLCHILGLGTVDDVGNERKGDHRKMWATVLVLVWLENKMAAEKDTWELVADKAWDWLRSQAGFDEGVIVEQARKVVGS